MKKLMLSIIMLFMFFTFAFAQPDGSDPPGEQIVAELGLGSYFASISAVATLVIVITQFLKVNLLADVKGWIIQATTWVVSIGISFFGWWLKLGIFADAEIMTVITYGIGIGLISNGLFDIPKGLLPKIRADT